MQKDIQDTKASYQFFKDYFNIDFNNLSPRKSKEAIDEINKILDERIADERRKILELSAQIAMEHFHIVQLSRPIQDEDYD